MGEAQRRQAFAAPIGDQRGQRPRRDDGIGGVAVDFLSKGVGESRRDGNGVAVESQRDGADHRRGETVEAERRSDDSRREHMGGVVNAKRQLVAQIGPGGFRAKLESEPFVPVEAFRGGDEEQSGVGERHEADAQGLGHFSSSAAVMMERAISTIFLPSFMATLRIIA